LPKEVGAREIGIAVSEAVVVGTEVLRCAVGLDEGANVDGLPMGWGTGTDGVLRSAVTPVEGAIVDGPSVANGIGAVGASVGLSLSSSSSSSFGDGAAVVGELKILGNAVEGVVVAAPFFRKAVGSSVGGIVGGSVDGLLVGSLVSARVDGDSAGATVDGSGVGLSVGIPLVE